jgi:hypothetical protein
MSGRPAASAAIALLLAALAFSPSHAAIAAATTTPAVVSSAAKRRPHRVRNETRQGYLTAASIAIRWDMSLRTFERRLNHPDATVRFPPPDEVTNGQRRWKHSTVTGYERRREQATRAAREAGAIPNPADRLKQARKAKQVESAEAGRRPKLVAAG